MTTDSCGINNMIVTIGDDSTRQNEDGYLYLPKDQSSVTYSQPDRTFTVERSGQTIIFSEDGQDYTAEHTLTFPDGYNSFTLTGWIDEDNPDECDGDETGKGIIVGTFGIKIDFNYLQYRTPAYQYRGWLDVYKDGIPPEASDITKVELKDSNGDTVNITVSSLLVTPIYYARWNSQTSTVDFSGPSFYSGFGIGFPGGFELPADNYTREVTTSENEVVQKPIIYPGKKELPFVDSATLQSVWLPDGSLQLSWTNPANNPPEDYEELFIIINSDVGQMLLAYLPADKEELTIPSNWVEILGDFYDPTNVSWQVMTRSYTTEGMNYARGISDSVPIP